MYPFLPYLTINSFLAYSLQAQTRLLNATFAAACPPGLPALSPPGWVRGARALQGPLLQHRPARAGAFRSVCACLSFGRWALGGWGLRCAHYFFVSTYYCDCYNMFA